MADDNLRNTALYLHRKITDNYEDTLFLPTGGAFLSITYERLTELISPRVQSAKRNDISNSDVRCIYAQWHESVHLGQLITSPYVFMHVLKLTSLAKHAAQNKHNLSALATEDMRRQYNAIRPHLAFTHTSSCYSAWDVLETQAVCLGINWLVPANDGVDRLELANFIYEENPRYLRVLNETAGKLGPEITFNILPKACFVALQTNSPGEALYLLIEEFKTSSFFESLATCTPQELLKWQGIDPFRVCRTLRERAQTLTYLDGRPLGLASHPWLHLFDCYFDALEKMDVHSRLDILMGTHGAYTTNILRPVFTVFSDGCIRLRQRCVPEAHELEKEMTELWLRETEQIISGIEILET